jgi:hypothetical protein
MDAGSVRQVSISNDCGVTNVPVKVLSNFEGVRIGRIYRQHYVFGGTADERTGALQLNFDDGRTLLLDSGSDGESLRIKTDPWADPFLGPRALNKQNEEFVARSGKWTEFEITKDSDFPLQPDLRPFLGATIVPIRPRFVADGRVTGAYITTTAGVIRAEVEGDDLEVTIDGNGRSHSEN